MHPDDALDRLEALEAIASERDLTLAFRACEESDGLEPVFIQILRANAGTEQEALLVAIADEQGLPLGRYVVNRATLTAALERADDIGAEASEPATVPVEWDAV